MSSLDVLHYALAIGFIILVLAVCYAIYCLTRLLRAFLALVAGVQDTARGIKFLKDKVQFNFLDLVGFFLGKALKKKTKKN